MSVRMEVDLRPVALTTYAFKVIGRRRASVLQIISEAKPQYRVSRQDAVKDTSVSDRAEYPRSIINGLSDAAHELSYAGAMVTNA